MAANFWTSTHCKNWILNRKQLLDSQAPDLEILSLEELFNFKIWHINLLYKIGKRMHIRQQVISTALVYFKRFYLRTSFRECDPTLVLCTCYYLACKIEESPQYVKTIVNEFRHGMQGHGGFLYDISDVTEFEFYLLEDLEFNLIIYHPYRPLLQYTNSINLDKSILQTAWFIVNDSYRTDVCLLYPPYMIALAAIYMSVVFNSKVKVGEGDKEKDMREWFSELSVDVEKIIEITQDLLTLYSHWSQYAESTIPHIRAKLKPYYSPQNAQPTNASGHLQLPPSSAASGKTSSPSVSGSTISRSHASPALPPQKSVEVGKSSLGSRVSGGGSASVESSSAGGSVSGQMDYKSESGHGGRELEEGEEEEGEDTGEDDESDVSSGDYPSVYE
ncbi:cyclin-like protein [Paraphysoderma sedebokerense]|nr:cyclin-like protein [Paraphysoderma sedebokerense]